MVELHPIPFQLQTINPIGKLQINDDVDDDDDNQMNVRCSC